MELKTKWDKAFYSCPGAWHGNAPTEDLHGCIVVDSQKIAEAIPYLHRRFSIVHTRTSAQDHNGIMIVLARK